MRARRRLYRAQPELRRSGPPATTAATAPVVVDGAPVLVARNLVAVQRSAGNQAAVLAVQRDGGGTTDTTEAAPPLEFIGGSGALGYSVGDHTRLTLRLMRRRRLSFVEAARLAADRLRGGRGGHPGRSAGVLDDPLAPVESRAAILFNAYGRPGRRGYLDVQAPSHPYMRGLVAGMRSQYGRRLDVVHNPSAADIGDVLDGHIDVMADEVGRGGRGELVVNFQGHGGPSSMQAADGNDFTLGDLMARARRARGHGIKLIVISDACFQGQSTGQAQFNTGNELEGRAARQAHQGDEVAREVFDEIYGANMLLSALRRLADNIQPLRGSVRAATPVADVRPPLEAAGRFLDMIRRHGPTLGPRLAGVAAEADTLDARVARALRRLRGNQVGAVAAEVNALWRALAAQHDAWSQLVTQVHEQADAVLALSDVAG